MKIKAIANLRFSNKDVLKIGEIMELSDSDAVDLIERELAEPVIEVKKKKNNPDLTKNENNKSTVSGKGSEVSDNVDSDTEQGVKPEANKTSAENTNLTNTTKEKDSSKSKPSNEKVENTDENKNKESKVSKTSKDTIKDTPNNVDNQLGNENAGVTLLPKIKEE